MRLLTQNMLQCPRTGAFPLLLTATTCDDVNVNFSERFIRRMIPRIDWDVFRQAANQLPDPDMLASLPDKAPSDDNLTEGMLKAIHRALMEWHVVDGHLQAEGSSTKYIIRNGTPNLVITEVVQPGADSMHMDSRTDGDADKSDNHNYNRDGGDAAADDDDSDDDSD